MNLTNETSGYSHCMGEEMVDFQYEQHFVTDFYNTNKAIFGQFSENVSLNDSIQLALINLRSRLL